MYRVKFQYVYELRGLKIKVTIWNHHRHYYCRRRRHRHLIEHQPVGFMIGFIGLIGRRPGKQNHIHPSVKMKNNLCVRRKKSTQYFKVLNKNENKNATYSRTFLVTFRKETSWKIIPLLSCIVE